MNIPRDLEKLSLSELKALKNELEYTKSIASTIEQAKKVTANSCYGTLGTKYFRHFDVRLAEAITLTGKVVINIIQNRVNEFLSKEFGVDKDYVIASDTDSLYITVQPFVESCQKTKSYTDVATRGNEATLEMVQEVDKFCGKIQEVIDDACKYINTELNTYASRFKMKREVIADCGIWKKKKHYILNMWSKESVFYHEPDLKIMGIEIVKTSTPEVCRNRLKDAVKIIVSGSEEQLQQYVKDFEKEFYTYSPEQIAFPRGVSNVEKFETSTGVAKGTPIHSRASIIYNRRLEHLNLLKYETIKDGDKIKFLYLKTPNPTGENVVAFPEILPEEFGLKPYIDYATQFDKTFIHPLTSILEVIGWSLKKKSKLIGLFKHG